MTNYFFIKFPHDGIPEASGYGVTVIPGFGQWMLTSGEDIPEGAIPVSDIVEFLEGETR
jgi:hypothetical protein